MSQSAKCLYSRAEIQQQIERLAKEITPWVIQARRESGQQVLAVCILRGGIFFFSDLVRAISESIEPTFCRAWSYSSETNQNTASGVHVSIDQVAAAGRSILLVDDICDTGATLKKLESVLFELGAKEVKTAVLIKRLIENPHCSPQWSAFSYQGAEWFYGYGMEDKNHHANLPDIYVLPSGQ